MKFVLVGSGVMGSAILASVVAAQPLRDAGAQVIVVDVRGPVAEEAAAEVADAARSHGITVAGSDDAAAAVVDADVVLLAVKPQHMAEAVAQIGPGLPQDALVVSVAAGLPTAWFEARLANRAVVRVMPNTPATIGQGVSAVSLGARARAEHSELVAALLAGTGLVVTVPEHLQPAVTGLSGSGPAYVFAMIDALAEAGTTLGLPRELALQLATHTVAGSGAYAAASGQHPALLREAVSSPGGTTLAGLGALDERAVRAAYVAAVRAASDRAEELGRTLAGPAQDQE